MVLAAFGAWHVSRWMRGSEAEARDAASGRLDTMIAQVIAERLNLTVEEVLLARELPERESRVSARVRECLGSVTVTFDLSNPDRVDCTVSLMLFLPGETPAESTARSPWSWDEVPQEVRERWLRTKEAVTIPWPFLADSADSKPA